MENVRWLGRRLLDGHAGSAVKVLVAIHYSVLDARNGYIRNVGGRHCSDRQYSDRHCSDRHCSDSIPVWHYPTYAII